MGPTEWGIVFVITVVAVALYIISRKNRIDEQWKINPTGMKCRFITGKTVVKKDYGNGQICIEDSLVVDKKRVKPLYF